MELYLYEGKIEKDILAKALDDLKVTEEEILYKKEVKNLFSVFLLKRFSPEY